MADEAVDTVTPAAIEPAVTEVEPTPPEHPPKTVTTARFLQLFSAIMLPMFLAVADQTLLATATPSIAAELGGLRDTTWIALGYMIAMTVTAPLWTPWRSLWAPRHVAVVDGPVWVRFTCLRPGAQPGAARDVAHCAGPGRRGLVVLSQALVGELVPPRERARFQGYFATNFSLASIGGPIIGGLVVHHFSWRWLFLANVPLCLLATWRVRKLPQLHNLDVRPFADALGAVLFSAAAGMSLGMGELRRTSL